jgi:hypothetical protein
MTALWVFIYLTTHYIHHCEEDAGALAEADDAAIHVFSLEPITPCPTLLGTKSVV